MAVEGNESPRNDDQNELPSALSFSVEFTITGGDFLEDFEAVVADSDADGDFLVTEVSFEEPLDSEERADFCLLEAVETG